MEKEMERVRNELLERLRLEFTGPNEEEEELEELPSLRYMNGILWPPESKVSTSEDDQVKIHEKKESTEKNTEEQDIPLSKSLNPSSIGLSFAVEQQCKSIKVIASYGRYHKLAHNHWKRVPRQEIFHVEVKETETRQHQMFIEDKDVYLEWIIRGFQNKYTISLFLVNKRFFSKEMKIEQDFDILFQPKIEVESGDTNFTHPFMTRQLEGNKDVFPLEETLSDDLLYHDKLVFAMGHGTSVEWFDVDDRTKRAGKLVTNTLPQYEVPRVIPKEWGGEGSLRMMELANAANGDEVYQLLYPLLQEYDEWIHKLDTKIQDIDDDLKEIAQKHKSNCRTSYDRMAAGLEVIRTNTNAYKAFVFANRAMAMQRAHGVIARENKKKKNWDYQPTAKDFYKAYWRPFQIAFILQSLTGVVKPEDDDRRICDLLWFPTGGGKTEAYLGLTAFTLGFRRLRGDIGGLDGSKGVTVIMRYTLRLLTIQQFQRATSLICACEVIRKENTTEYGHEPFSIGLWVGGGSTPNKSKDVKQAMQTMLDAMRTKSLDNVFFPNGSPFQLIVCPWCGSPLLDSQMNLRLSYVTDPKTGQLNICCSNRKCKFSKVNNPIGLPVYVVDDTLYDHYPSLVIGTVDKFARIPWVEETSNLFGKNIGILPPELIIQDELHLISGPLGTIVGLYESTIDELCSYEVNGQKIKPKVIASTATIRRAKEQVRALFNRDLAIFPSPGINASDSYFAVEQSVKDKPGRIYLGVFAPGKSMKTALLRIYAALLASTGPMKYQDENIDPYRTIVGYFNSLRELGGAVRLVEDDVRARMNILEKRTKGQIFPYKSRKYSFDVPELTSRISSNKIPEILENLEKQVNEDTGEGIHTVLASNMISVGMDVPRLGLMVVNAQPKTTAEYIQATSRVGREHPGLVITLYNWVRPRDVSHYENFIGYHSSLYRYVEAISVTPFASRARDKALAGMFVALCRLHIEGFVENDSAQNIKNYTNQINELKETIIMRVKEIDGAERASEVDEDLSKIIRIWGEKADQGRLTYTKKGESPHLITSLESGVKQNFDALPIPNSMRDVEPQIGIYLLED
ncbi:helicase-related protein [Neobacillus sp. NPDC093182]|uniref:helicase-related protein n=1 Tax=Neobacillus sp. NPDC093182 TaxID=3364297 RepID=UPI00381EF226